MKLAIHVAAALISSLMAGLPVYADPAESAPMRSTTNANDLAAIVRSIAPISQETMLRRTFAQATFCVPQNILGRLLYGFFQVTGSVVETARMNEVKIVATKARAMRITFARFHSRS